MPKAYSQDLREKAITAIERRVSKSEVVKMFNISRDSLERWLKRRSDTGNVAAAQGYQRGHSHRIVDGSVRDYYAIAFCAEPIKASKTVFCHC